MIDWSSAKTVMASSKLTPCFRRFAIAFWASHSNFTTAVYLGRLQALTFEAPAPCRIDGRDELRGSQRISQGKGCGGSQRIYRLAWRHAAGPFAHQWMNGTRGDVSAVTANVSFVSHIISRFVNHGLSGFPLTPPGRLD